MEVHLVVLAALLVVLALVILVLGVLLIILLMVGPLIRRRSLVVTLWHRSIPMARRLEAPTVWPSLTCPCLILMFSLPPTVLVITAPAMELKSRFLLLIPVLTRMAPLLTMVPRVLVLVTCPVLCPLTPR